MDTIQNAFYLNDPFTGTETMTNNNHFALKYSKWTLSGSYDEKH